MSIIDKYYQDLFYNVIPQLSYSEDNNYESWRELLKVKLVDLLGRMPEHRATSPVIEWRKEHKGFTEVRFVIESEAGYNVPCHLLFPHDSSSPCHVVVCLQGHSTGMHISLGRALYDGDKELIEGDRDFALQAVKQGYAALVIEQRGFGERKTGKDAGCLYPAMSCLLLGQTLLGRRVWDVMRAIDALGFFDEVDSNNVGCMGNSGGGTVAYYTACLDARIKIVMPSCSVCSYRASIGTRLHCSCNYVPNAARYFDMADLAALIAPRALIVVAGQHDEDFPIEGVREAYHRIEQVYDRCGCSDKARLLVGEAGHRFYSEIGWKAYKDMMSNI